MSVHYFGIRHHGPGSARQLLQALEELRPAQVLIEGPADASELLALLAKADMRPPVALLSYAADEPANAVFHPFAEFSPELQASRWAVRNGALLRMIDLPSTIRLVKPEPVEKPELSEEEGSDVDPDLGLEAAEAEPESPSEPPEPAEQEAPSPILQDPIGVLAQAAGYGDGEAWWNDLIEQNQDGGPIFEAIEEAMTALRENITTLPEWEARREAYLRLEIAKAVKAAKAEQPEGPIAVVCGAWHVPALKAKHTAKDDRALLKGLPKVKVKTTWVPWTNPRLAYASGYGAGVKAPRWYQHLWQYGQAADGVALERWLADVGRRLRDQGQVVSTASIIEAVRLATSLAVVRDRPQAGFDEMRDSVVACLCFGEAALWQTLEATVLLGDDVGAIPEDTPLMPLLEDLQRQQKKARLKPEALARELSLDLRSDSGLFRSVLLHRLNFLAIPWGELSDAGNSRGTFRERWQLTWEPEYSVTLVENLVYGTTIEQAASNKAITQLKDEQKLQALAHLVQATLEAQLPDAASQGLQQLNARASHSQDCVELLNALPALVSLVRYGTARQLDGVQLQQLVDSLTVRAALALPYAARNLNSDEAVVLRDSLAAAHQAVELAELGDHDIMAQWWRALTDITEHEQSSQMVAGLCARLRYEAEQLDAEQLQWLLGRALSPAQPVPQAAQFFDGFFSNAAQRLLHDPLLRDAVEAWLLSLEQDSFIEYLPLFRRIFSDLDAMERKRLLDCVLPNARREQAGTKWASELEPLWQQHLQRLDTLLRVG